MSRGTGALPPPNMAWQMGKTAASIRFVGDAQRYLESCQDEEQRQRLEEAIDKVRKGELVMDNWTTPKQFLAK